jgi:hypothetical protein
MNTDKRGFSASALIGGERRESRDLAANRGSESNGSHRDGVVAPTIGIPLVVR